VPVGSHQEIPIDVRIVAATNRDLAREVGLGRFRDDLFYRLNVVTIQTMPLKERPEDIPVLASRYLAELAGRHGMPMCMLSPAATSVLQAYAWPGNVRELENVLERAVMFSSGDAIEPESLTGFITPVDSRGSEQPPAGTSTAAAGKDLSQLVRATAHGILSTTALRGVYRVEPNFKEPSQEVESEALRPASDQADRDETAGSETLWPTLADVERLHLERTLVESLQNKSLAAKMLGIDRSVLRRKLHRYGLEGSDTSGTDTSE